MSKSPTLLAGLFACFLLACPSEPPQRCGPGTCSGCCSIQGECLGGVSSTGCGQNGSVCAVCLSTQQCIQGMCSGAGLGGSPGAGGDGQGGGAGGSAMGGAGGADDAGIMVTCVAGFALCDGVCRETTTDLLACGGCGQACGVSEFCNNGTCSALPADCTTGGCPRGFNCDLGSRQCLTGCRNPTDCFAGSTCDRSTGRCLCPANSQQCGQNCVPENTVTACGPNCLSCTGILNAVPRCESGSCDFTCSRGFHRCGDRCASDTDAATCGNSCSPCPAPPNASPSCDGASCGFVCNAGYHRCGDLCVSDNEVATCGQSCQACTAPPGSTPTCDGIACGFTCPAGQHRCGTQCVSNMAVSSCGASSCTPCPAPPNAVATCDGTACGFTCAAGSHRCGSQCVSNNDVNSCGSTSCTACPVPTNGIANCNGVACGVQCNSGFHACNGQCVSNSAIATCGDRCAACPGGPAGSATTCVSSAPAPGGFVCSFTCNAGFSPCSGQCVPNSPTTCGNTCAMCPVPAGGSAVCSSAGVCDFTCNAGLRRCGNRCVTEDDIDNCGACGVVCASGGPNSVRTCTRPSPASAYGCVIGCTSGTNRCGSLCVSADYNLACGASCSACGAPGLNEKATCSAAGVCLSQCVTTCAGQCTNTQTSASHCGGCGVACGSGQSCSQGECRATCASGPALRDLLPVTTFQVGLPPFGVFDVNGDGVGDLVSFESTTLRIRLGQSGSLAGRFGVPYAAATITAISSFAVGDVTGDGRPEVLAWSGSTLQVMRNGGGTSPTFSVTSLTPSTAAGFPVSGITGVAVGEFNGAAPADVIITFATPTTNQSAAVYVGNGLGSANPLAATPIASNLGIGGIVGVRAGQLNGDALSDVVVTAGTAGLFAYLGTGAGNLFNVAATLSIQLPAGETFSTAVTGGLPFELGDVTGDAIPDVVVAAQSSLSTPVMRVLPLTAGPVFGTPVAISLSSQPRSVVLADVDGDARRDVVTLTANSISLAPSTALTSPTLLPVQAATTTGHVHQLAVSDVTQDNRPELFFFTSSLQLVVLPNEGSGQFTSVRGTPVPNASRMVVADFNGDGLSDVVALPTGFSGTATAQVLFGGTSAFSVGPTLTVRGDVVAAGNLNGDAPRDLITTDSIISDGGVAGFGLAVQFGSTAGTFSAPVALVTSAAPRFAVTSDVTGDGREDIIVVTANGVEWFTNQGSQTFAARQTVALGTSTSAAVVDLNLDGRNDIVLANTSLSTSTVTPWLNLGSGFSPLGLTSVSNATGQVVRVTDFSNDGKPDAIIGEASLRNNGLGVFTNNAVFAFSSRTIQAVADFDNDSAPDVYSVGGGLPTWQLYRGSFAVTAGFLSPATELANGLIPVEAAVARVNTDSLRDLIVLQGNLGSRQVVALPGVCR